MTSILQKIDDSISASRKDAEIIVSESFTDDSSMLFISAKMDAETLSLWQEVFVNIPEWMSFEFKDDCNDIIKPAAGNPGETFKIDISSQSYKSSRFIFTIEGWKSFLYDDVLISTTQQINLLGLKTSFSTLGFIALPWENKPTPLQQELLKENPPNAKTLVRFLSNDFLPPSNLYPWILKGENEAKDAYFIKWKNISCIALAKCIANELYNSGERYILLSGKPPRKIKFGVFEDEEKSFNILQSVASWIFIEGQESELKHTFLTSELAREWPDTLNFCSAIHKKLPLAYESAKLLYKAHIRSSSKETIKSLSDLRKNLTEDTQKIVQQTRDLTSSLWKDLALTISTIVIKYALDFSKAGSDSKLFSYVFFAVSIYVFISQAVSLFINHKYSSILDSSRAIWREKLYGFLDDDDYNKLASDPIQKASKAYLTIAIITTIISFGMSVLLFYLGLSTLHPIETAPLELLDSTPSYVTFILNKVAR